MEQTMTRGRVRVEHGRKRVRAYLGGELAADTTSPLTDVRLDLLRPSATQSHCPHKGTASYWSLDTGTAIHQDFVWIYRSPLPESQKIAGLACFYNEKADLYLDGVLQERPQTKFS